MSEEFKLKSQKVEESKETRTIKAVLNYINSFVSGYETYPGTNPGDTLMSGNIEDSESLRAKAPKIVDENGKRISDPNKLGEMLISYIRSLGKSSQASFVRMPIRVNNRSFTATLWSIKNSRVTWLLRERTKANVTNIKLDTVERSKKDDMEDIGEISLSGSKADDDIMDD
jgi:hypothetical protein